MGILAKLQSGIIDDEFETTSEAVNGQYCSKDKPRSILVIDDSKTALASIRKIVKQCGFECYLMSSAVDGIVFAKTNNPDLILMDIEMPTMNGFQATRALRDEPTTQDIPVIIISGTVTPIEKRWGEKIGANGFLPKPLNTSDFLNISSRVWNQSHSSAS